jgi:hypothetical protein
MSSLTPIFDAVKRDLGGDPRNPIARAQVLIAWVLDTITSVISGIGAESPKPAGLYGPLPARLEPPRIFDEMRLQQAADHAERVITFCEARTLYVLSDWQKRVVKAIYATQPLIVRCRLWLTGDS